MDIQILGGHLREGFWKSQAVASSAVRAHLSAVLDRYEVVTVEVESPPGAREKLHVTFFFPSSKFCKACTPELIEKLIKRVHCQLYSVTKERVPRLSCRYCDV